MNADFFLSEHNGTALSKSCDVAPLPLFEALALDIAWLGQQPMRLWPSLDRPGLDPVRSFGYQ